MERRSHPDLYVLEAVGDQIRIDDIRTLRHDLHMRPFEADRRVYLIFGADTMNEDAADALLKDLEEPPSYAVILLIANDLGPLPETIRSRCQLVPFRRLSERAVREEIARRAPDLAEEEVATLARVAAGGSTVPSACSTTRPSTGGSRCSASLAPSISIRRSTPATGRRRCSPGSPSAGRRRARRRRRRWRCSS